MKHISLALLPMFALGLVACADIQNPVTPRAATVDRAVTTGAPAIAGGPTTVIYSNFGPGMTFDTNRTHAQFIKSPPFGQTVSQQFSTPPGEYTFAQAAIAASQFSGSGPIRVLLQVDSSGRAGHVVEEMSIDSIGSTPAVYVVRSTLAPILGDTLYWLTLAAGHTGMVVAWNWNSIGDRSRNDWLSDVALTLSDPPAWLAAWLPLPGITRSALQIDGRVLPPRGALLHQASGGGTVLWPPPPGETSDTETVTYNITARQMADGSVKGQLLFHRHGDQSQQFKGTVTCLTVVGNRAFLSGDLAQSKPPFSSLHFAIGLEDNGEGSNAIQPDRISSLILLPDGWPPCYRVTPLTDWTHGNAQVK